MPRKPQQKRARFQLYAVTAPDGRHRRMIAAESQREAAYHMGVSEHRLRHYGIDIGNPTTRTLAHASPGTVFESPCNADNWQPASIEPYRVRRVAHAGPLRTTGSGHLTLRADLQKLMDRQSTRLFTLMPEDRNEIAGCGGIEHQNGTTTVTLHFVDEEAAHAFMRVGKPAVKSADMPRREYVVKGRPLTDLTDTVVGHTADLLPSEIRAVLQVLDDIGAGVIVPNRPEPSGDVIARSKRILALVDDYHDQPTADTRSKLRHALVDEFSSLLQPVSKKDGA